VGCDQALLKELLPLADYIGVDMGGLPDLRLNLETVQHLPFEDGQFHSCVCSDVLEHLDNLHAIFAELVRVTQRYLLISLPNNWANARRPIERGHGRIAHYGLPPERPGDRHKWFFGFDEARAFLLAQCERYPLRLKELVANDKHRMKQFYQRFFQKASIHGAIPKPKGYFIPHWKKMTLYQDRVLYVGDSASLVLPFTYEGIYYALKSGKLAADALLKNDPFLYEKTWNNLYLKKFKFLRILQSIFLKNDWFSTRMSRFYAHERFQRAVLGYWSGSRKPAGFFPTILKVIKALFFYR